MPAKTRKPLSAETRAKISASNKGRKIDPAIVKRLADQRRGKPLRLTDEKREAMRQRQLGKTMPEETRAKISTANKGRRLTMSDRVLRSLTAMIQERGARLNRHLAENPALAAVRRAKATANLQQVNDAARAARLAPRPANGILEGVPSVLRAAWRSAGNRAAR